jgi:hypothetical protein
MEPYYISPLGVAHRRSESGNYAASEACVVPVVIIPTRREIVFLLAIFTAVTIPIPSAHAASRYWVGSAGGNTNDANNWSGTNPTECAGGGAGVPSAADIAIFDADCDSNATVNANLSVDGVQIDSGYTGTITQGTSTITVGASAWVQNDGVFTGGSVAIDINGALTVNAGTFTATSNTTSVERDVAIALAATFSHNSGTFALDGMFEGDSTVSAPSKTFNRVTVNRATANYSQNSTLTIAANTILPLGNTATVTLNNSHASKVYGLINNGSIILGTGTFTNSVEGVFLNAGQIITETATVGGAGSITNTGGSTVEFIGDGVGRLTPLR